MPDSSKAEPPRAFGICPDCGAAYDESVRLGSPANCCNACQLKRLAFVNTVRRAVVPPEPRKPWFRSRLVWCLLLAVLAGAAGLLWRKEIFYQCQQWSLDMHARRAVRNFETKDYAHAILDGKRALEFDPLDIESNRIIAKSLEATESPEAISWRMRLNIIRPGDVENSIAWARDALKAGSIEMAEDALATIKAGDRENADWHDIMAQIAMARTDSVKAESHWVDAVRLNPGSEDFRLRLATLQLRSRKEDIREAARKTLESLGEIPGHRLPALRALVEDAMNREEFPRARQLADQLVASPDARFTERLGRLSVLRTMDAPDAPKYLEQLRDESLADPEQFSLLLRWMNQNGLPVLVSSWVPALPPELVSQPPVCFAVADAYGRDRDWPKLRAFVETAVWKDYEHVRLAHLAHALENFGNVVAAETMWGRAIAECRDKTERLSVLVRLAQSWHWDARAEFTLRKLSADERTPLWLLDSMWAVAKKTGDVEELHRLSRLIVKSRPKNIGARNNFIRLSLLRRVDEGATDKLAAELYRERPTDITCATTFALSLFFSGKVFDAIQVMQSFTPAQLRDPDAALYYGIFLQASGDTKKAERFLAIGQQNTLLHQEEELVARVKRESRFNTLTLAPEKPQDPPKKE
jgi:tetratricopeptide (TPR) repeat protein